MEQYIALLRGINVSGKNKVAMPLLKEVFIEAGFTEISTYINSGNVLFSSTLCDLTAINEMCTTLVSERFQLDIPVVVLSLKELSLALDNAPTWWGVQGSEDMIHQAIFLIPPATIAEIYTAVGEAKDDFEQVDHYGNVIFWSAPRATLSKTRWYKIPSSAANKKVTIRNANTTKKLVILSMTSN